MSKKNKDKYRMWTGLPPPNLLIHEEKKGHWIRNTGIGLVIIVAIWGIVTLIF